MDPRTGAYRELSEGEQPAEGEVLIVGTPKEVHRISEAIKAKRRAKSKAARKSRRAGR